MAAATRAQFDYVTNAGGTSVTIIGYSTNGPDAVIIPPVINGLAVTVIGEYAFSTADVTSVMIADTVTNIGYAAFANSSSLTNVTIPDSVVSISESAFTGAGLTSIIIPDSVTNIPQGAFQGCFSLTNVVIPDSVVSIGDSAFDSSGLTSVLIPGGLTNIGYGAVSVGGSLTNVTISYGLTSIGAAMFGGCHNLPNVTIPASVTNIGEQAFIGCDNLTQVYFMGDAPGVGPTSFQNTRPIPPGDQGYTNFYVATAYYLPGTTGWAEFSSNTLLAVNPDSPIYISVPAVLWNPMIQASGANFGVQSNQFGFDITGTTNIPIVIEASTNLAQPVWLPLQSMTLTNGLVHFSESLQTNSPARFYRIGAP